MNARTHAGRSLFAAGALAALVPLAVGAEGLELQRVMLSAGGVGYFEYEARVEGDATLELSVRLDQVDDVMKSIVVFDDLGTAGAIRLAGRDPVEQIFRDLPFGPGALDSPVALLNALAGAGMRATGQREISGRLVRVVPENQRLGDGAGSVTRHRVTLMTDAGLQSFLLEEADAVRFTDPALAAQVDGALEAVSAHRTRDRRTLHVSSRGEGARTVRVGYVVSAPLWKATYRLSMDAPERARLQGWAVLENMSGQDWNGVELTLVSGNPVTFRQALYAAYYAERPEVPVEVLGRVLPAPDTGALAGAPSPAPPPGRSVGQAEAMVGAKRVQRPALALSAPQAAMADVAAEPERAPGQARVLAAASTEAATSVSFRIPGAVNVSSGQSLLVPVIDREVPAERVSLYQPATHARHPLAAVLVRNDGESGLPPGVLTLYEAGENGSTFVGDAQLSPLPAGEERLVSYALDQKTLVDREDRSTQTVSRGRIVDGVLELTYAQRQRTVYRMKAPAREARAVVIEHPRIGGWELDAPDPARVTLTATHYRFEQQLRAGGTAEVSVVLARPLVRRVELLNLSNDRLVAYASDTALTPALREAFRGLAKLAAVLEAQQRRLEEIEQARGSIREEQERIRGNLARVPRDTDLYGRYLRKLDAQEDTLESLHAESERVHLAIDEARAALAAAIRRLDI